MKIIFKQIAILLLCLAGSTMGCSSRDLLRPRDVLADMTREIIAIKIAIYSLNIAITKDVHSQRGRLTEKIRDCTNRLTYITSQLADIGRQNKLADIQSKIIDTQNTLLAMRLQLALDLDMVRTVESRGGGIQSTVDLDADLIRRPLTVMPVTGVLHRPTSHPKPLVRIPVAIEVPVPVQCIQGRTVSEQSSLSLSITRNLSVAEDPMYLNTTPSHTCWTAMTESGLDYPESVRNKKMMVTVEKSGRQNNTIAESNDKGKQDNSQYDPTPRQLFSERSLISVATIY